MKVRDVVKLLEEVGWRHVRTKGSHRQFKHADNAMLVTVAGKLGTEIPRGTLKQILRQAGIEQ
jgi:predicted RNA binding protein YcfA (HicA-like mRNA interferase family)